MIKPPRHLCRHPWLGFAPRKQTCQWNSWMKGPKADPHRGQVAVLFKSRSSHVTLMKDAICVTWRQYIRSVSPFQPLTVVRSASQRVLIQGYTLERCTQSHCLTISYDTGRFPCEPRTLPKAFHVATRMIDARGNQGAQTENTLKDSAIAVYLRNETDVSFRDGALPTFVDPGPSSICSVRPSPKDRSELRFEKIVQCHLVS